MKYQKRPPFLLLQRIATYELEDVDRLVTWSEQMRRSRGKFLERLMSSPRHHDQFVDDFAEIDAFAHLYGECAIVALWRCVELFRKRALTQALGASVANKAFKNQCFIKELRMVDIIETKVQCHKSVNELRCLNNAIKHEKRVGGELAELPKWKKREGQDLKDLLLHCKRLRPMAEKYINDLTSQLNSWWKRNST